MSSRRDQIRMSDAEVAAKDAFREQAKKRIGMRFTPTRVVSWDHSKLGEGVY